MKWVLRAFVVWGLVWAAPAGGQNHPELEWEMVETEHFRIYFYPGLESAAQRASVIAEEAYGPITQFYHYEPSSKVRILLKDYDDYANGAAYYYHDTIEIWATGLEHDFDLRGTSDWLRNVITHEFVHIVSLGAATKTSQRVPALYLQYFGYQREPNRPDVLVGYPDVLGSYPVPTTSIPMWLAEGVAQYQVMGARYDRWDTHRDMVLRMAVLNGGLLSFEQMGVFGKKGFGNEFVYDHGYGLVSYIGATYGEDKVAALCNVLSGWSTWQVGGAFKKVLGVSVEEVYGGWRQSMEKRYRSQVEGLGNTRPGIAVASTGFSNIRPALSPDGKRLAYLSTGQRQYGPHALVVRDVASGEEEVVAVGVSSTVSWAADSRRLLFVRKGKADKYGSRQADIFELDLEAEGRGLLSNIAWSLPGLVAGIGPQAPQTKRLSRGLRAHYPAYSPDGRWIAFVHNRGSSNNLALMRADGTGVQYLTQFSDGTQLYTPQWSPDGSTLALSVARGGQRDIALFRLNADRQLAAAVPLEPVANTLEVVVATEATDRDPAWSGDGQWLYFSSDISGIANIYAVELATGKVVQVTNVVGGGFNPSVGAEQLVFFTAYDEGGFEIRQIDAAQARPVTWSGGGGAQMEVRAALPTTVESRPAPTDFLRTSILPRLMIDEGRFKGGFYISAGDVLARQNVFAGAALAPTSGDRDLFAIYEYRRWRPTVFLEVFHQRKNSSRNDSTDARDVVITGTNFTLSQINVGLRGKLGRRAELSLSATYDRYDASVAWRAFDPQKVEWLKQKPIGYTYLNGFDLGLTYRYESVARRRDQQINPSSGRRIYLRYDRMFNYFLEEFNQSVGFIDEEYLKLFYNQVTLDWNEYVGLPGGLTLGLRFYGGWIASDKVDDKDLVNDFFDYHLGGIQYMKGYTFYSIEGRKAAMGNMTLRFPLLPDLGRRFLHLYIDKVYGAIYGDIGKGWDEAFDQPDPFYGRKGPLRDLGGQLRFDMLSYYSMPTRIQLDLAYGIDERAGESPWKFYMTVLFGYL